jgi:hypothetical protein
VAERAWRFIVRLIGGFHELGRVAVVIHDHGAYVAVDRVVRWSVGR